MRAAVRCPYPGKFQRQGASRPPRFRETMLEAVRDRETQRALSLRPTQQVGQAYLVTFNWHDEASEFHPMSSEIDTIRALLTSKPRPIGWLERRQRIDEIGSTWPIADDVKVEAVNLGGVPGEFSIVPGS